MGSNIENLVLQILSLEKEEFRSVMCTIARKNPFPDLNSYITNKFQKARHDNKNPNKASNKDPVREKDFKMFVKPPPQELKKGREGRVELRSRAMGSSPFASLLPDIHGASAWQVPVIFRGDLVPVNGKLFLDIEKVSMKIGWNGGNKHRQIAVNVAVVNEEGAIVLWAFINRNPNEICQWNTSLHKIDKAKIRGGASIETVRWLLDFCIRDNTIVGAKVKDDLASMSLDNEFKNQQLFSHSSMIDLQDFFRDSKRQPYKLKDLVQHFYPERSPNFQAGAHSSVSDARMTMNLYFKMSEMQASDTQMLDTSSMIIQRTKKEKMNYDKCKCVNSNK